jgi:hypothetical protein
MPWRAPRACSDKQEYSDGHPHPCLSWLRWGSGCLGPRHSKADTCARYRSELQFVQPCLGLVGGWTMLVTWPHLGHSYAIRPGSWSSGAMVVTSAICADLHRGHRMLPVCSDTTCLGGFMGLFDGCVPLRIIPTRSLRLGCPTYARAGPAGSLSAHPHRLPVSHRAVGMPRTAHNGATCWGNTPKVFLWSRGNIP